MIDIALAMLHPVTVAVAATGSTGASCPRCSGKTFVTEPTENVFAIRQFHRSACPLAAEIRQALPTRSPQ